MPNLEIKEELVKAIEKKGQNADKFANNAIEDALKAKRARIKKYSSESCCFEDYHCIG